MKKIFFLGAIFALFTVAASAQQGRNAITDHRIEKGFNKGQLTRGEKFRLHNHEMRYDHAKRKAKKDGHINRFERKKLHKMRVHNRREITRFKHNSRKRVI